MSRLRLSTFALLACTTLPLPSLGCNSLTGSQATTETSSPSPTMRHPGGHEFDVVKDPTIVRILSTPTGGTGNPSLAGHLFVEDCGVGG